MRGFFLLLLVTASHAADIATLFESPKANAIAIKQAADQGGPAIAPALIKQVQNQTDRQTRDFALDMLYSVARPEHLPAIAEFAKTRELRERAIAILVLLGRETPEPAIAALRTLGDEPPIIKALGALRAQRFCLRSKARPSTMILGIATRPIAP